MWTVQSQSHPGEEKLAAAERSQRGSSWEGRGSSATPAERTAGRLGRDAKEKKRVLGRVRKKQKVKEVAGQLCGEKGEVVAESRGEAELCSSSFATREKWPSLTELTPEMVGGQSAAHEPREPLGRALGKISAELLFVSPLNSASKVNRKAFPGINWEKFKGLPLECLWLCECSSSSPSATSPLPSLVLLDMPGLSQPGRAGRVSWHSRLLPRMQQALHGRAALAEGILLLAAFGALSAK